MEDAKRRDRDLEAQIGQWRTWQERTSSLSPRELDELEDHLRARIDLEMELNAALAPTRAFHVARREMGTGRALSKEYAKVGKPRWRGLFVAGWAKFGRAKRKKGEGPRHRRNTSNPPARP